MSRIIQGNPLVDVQNLVKVFSVSGGTLHAVNGLNLSIYEGETVGLVGESGCGKSTAGRTILRMYDGGYSGAVLYEGQNIFSLKKRDMKQLRTKMQMIFQDPYASLNGRMTVGSIIEEPMAIHSIGTPTERKERVEELLGMVGLKSEHKNRFPHEFSGGQRQRICIARALSVNPKFVVCDEPISSLDVSIQAQVVNLMKDLQDRLGLTYLFIAHDLSVVKYISDRILVMYLGKSMELASSEELTSNPCHPYTKALLGAVPNPNPNHKLSSKPVLEGEIPNPINPPKGCVFNTRCPSAFDKCMVSTPEWKEISRGHQVACHLY